MCKGTCGVVSGDGVCGMELKKNCPKQGHTIGLDGRPGDWVLEEVLSVILCFSCLVSRKRIY